MTKKYKDRCKTACVVKIVTNRNVVNDKITNEVSLVIFLIYVKYVRKLIFVF